MVKLKDICHLDWGVGQVMCVRSEQPGIYKATNMHTNDIFLGDMKNTLAKLDWGVNKPETKYKDNNKISIELLEVKIEKNYKKIKKSFVLDVLIKLGMINEV